MSTFVRILKIIGRALRRAIFAIGRFFKFTAKKIGKASKTSKLNKRIGKKEKAIEKLYSEIGRNYYEAHSDAPEALLSELCGSVGENKTFIAEAQDKIAALQEAYTAAKAEAKEKAKARRAADKDAAKADKAAANGEIIEEEIVEEAPAAAPVFTAPDPAPVYEAPSPVVEPAPAAAEPAPEIAAEPVPAPVAEESAPVTAEEPAPAFEAPVTPEEQALEATVDAVLDAIPDEPAAPEAPVEETVPAE